MNFAPLLIALLAAQPPDQPAPSSCGLDPQIQKTLCGGAETERSLCGWLPILESMAAGDFSSAESRLAGLFGVEQSLAKTLLPFLSITSPPLTVDPHCRELQGHGFLRVFQEAGFPVGPRQNPDQTFFSGFVFDLPPELLNLLMEDVDPSHRPQISRIGLSYRDLLESLPGSAAPRMFHQEGFFDGIKLGRFEPGFADEVEQEEVRQIEQALGELASGETAAGRQRMRDLASAKPPLFATRAAFALAKSGFLPECLSLLELARDKLNRAGFAEPLNRYTSILVGWLESCVLMELGQPAESRRVFEALASIKDETAQNFLKILPSPDSQEGGFANPSKLDAASFAELMLRLEGTAEGRALWQTLESVWPRISRRMLSSNGNDATGTAPNVTDS